MKVVLFCGGLGLRITDAAQPMPKPLVPLGDRPLLWHIMRYYAHFGHDDFVLCLGYNAGLIESQVSELLDSNDKKWNVQFVDTGLRASIGERLFAVRDLVADEELFLANYGDVLTDAPLPDLVTHLAKSDAVAAFLCVRPNYAFHVVTLDDAEVVTGIQDIGNTATRINGGYFVFRPEIFDYLRPGEDLMAEPIRRLIRDRRLLAYTHDGFWAPMDTLKDRQRLEALAAWPRPPWQVWQPKARFGPLRRAGAVISGL